MRVGRHSTNTVRLLDTTVSREHAELRLEHGMWTISDLGSHLGTRVNGREVLAPTAIAAGDRLEVGRVSLQVTEEEPEPWIDPGRMEERQRLALEAANARRIQAEMLREPPTVPGWRCHARINPCDEAGSDFYDLHIRDDGRLVVVVGDVSGKGMSAANLMSSMLSSARALYDECRDPLQLVKRLNESLRWSGDGGSFVTIFVGWLDPVSGLLRYVNAGYPDPYILRGGMVRPIEATGIPVGLMADFAWSEAELMLQHGETIALYSDGVTDRERGDDIFGRRCLVEALREARDERDLAAMADRVLARINELAAHDPPVDDVLLLLIRRE